MLRHTSVFRRNYRELACSVKERNVTAHPPARCAVMSVTHVCLLLHCFVCFCCTAPSPTALCRPWWKVCSACDALRTCGVAGLCSSDMFASVSQLLTHQHQGTLSRCSQRLHSPDVHCCFPGLQLVFYGITWWALRLVPCLRLSLGDSCVAVPLPANSSHTFWHSCSRCSPWGPTCPACYGMILPWVVCVLRS